MRVLQDTAAIHGAIVTLPDEAVRQLMAGRVAFLAQNDEVDDLGDAIRFLFVEPGDSVTTIDAEMNGALLSNPYSGKRYGDAGFDPCFETLEEYPTFYVMTFIQGDGEFCIEVVVPKHHGIDTEILTLCAEHATPAREAAP